jgi:anthranilate phosphoribosyltransferase
LKKYTFVKGLEGSCDLLGERTAIIGFSSSKTQELERLLLVPHEYGFTPKNVSLGTTEEVIKDIQSVLAGEPREFMQTALWNGCFYLWHSGICPHIPAGIDKAKELFSSGVVAAKLRELIPVPCHLLRVLHRQ